MNQCVILLGTNTGDLEKNLLNASGLITERIGDIQKSSKIYETEPWGIKDQPAFLNKVIVISTVHNASSVMKLLLGIEEELGRKREKKWAPRIIDLDILYFNDEIINEPGLIIPHPHLHERRFTLVPLCEVLAGMVHPVIKKKNEELLTCLADNSGVEVLKAEPSPRK